MKTVAKEVQKGLERLGYDYNPSGQFSVEITGTTVVVNQKVELSCLTKQKDILNLMFYLNGNAFGAPLHINRLSASLYRYPPKNSHSQKIQTQPQILIKNNYEIPFNHIPTKSELYDLVAKQLNIENTNIIKLLSGDTDIMFQNRTTLHK